MSTAHAIGSRRAEVRRFSELDGSGRRERDPKAAGAIRRDRRCRGIKVGTGSNVARRNEAPPMVGRDQSQSVRSSCPLEAIDRNGLYRRKSQRTGQLGTEKCPYPEFSKISTLGLTSTS